MICRYFLLFCRLSFHFLDGNPWCIKVLNFDGIQFIYFYFCCLHFLCYIHEKDWPFPIEWFWWPCWKSVDHICEDLFLYKALYSVALIYVYLLRSVPYCLTYYSFVVSLKLRSVSPVTLFLLKIVLAVLGPLEFHMNLKISFSISVEKAIGFW